MLGRDNRIMKRVRGGGITGGNIRGGIGAKRKMLSQWASQNGSLIGQLVAPQQQQQPQQQATQAQQTQQQQQQPHSSPQQQQLQAPSQPQQSPTSQPQMQQDSFLSTLMLQSPIEEGSSSSLVSNLPFDSELNSFPSSGDKVMQPPEEPPYFPEKWAGKLCALCCLGERSQLGQGEMLRIEVKDDETKVSSLNSSLEDRASTSSQDDKSPKGFNAVPQMSNRRQKGLNKCK